MMVRFGVPMLVSGSLYADLFARLGASSSRQEARDAPTARETGAAPAPAGDAAGADGRPPHFSVISTIRPGSLAAAYQAMRAREDGAGPAASGPAQAILSGQGVPSALSAYREVLESD